MIPVGVCATLACVWEATAPKPGNVYRGADFDDLTYADFLTSAAVVGPLLDQTAERGVGFTVRAAVEATRSAVDTNTNLGMLLLMAPLAAVARQQPLSDGVDQVLEGLSVEDTREVYAAISTAQPGGLGEVAEADVHAPPPDIPLVAAMRLAAERDLVALQYTNGFQQVFLAARRLEAAIAKGQSLCDAIVRCYLQMLAEFPDSLISRKCGEEVAKEVSLRAEGVLDSGGEYQNQVAELDFWLRSDGHRLNPGTTADLVAAGLFVLLRDERLDWPIRFY